MEVVCVLQDEVTSGIVGIAGGGGWFLEEDAVAVGIGCLGGGDPIGLKMGGDEGVVCVVDCVAGCDEDAIGSHFFDFTTELIIGIGCCGGRI